jgi:parvulin-like peptidyl-prolyl isomerase
VTASRPRPTAATADRSTRRRTPAVWAVIVACCAVTAFARAADQRPAEAAPIVARVGAATITRAAVDAVVRRLGTSAAASREQREKVEASVLEQLIDEALLLEEIDRQAVQVTASEIDAGLERLKGQLAGRGITLDKFLAESGRDIQGLRSQLKLEAGLDKFIRSRMTPAAINATFEAHRRELDGTRLRVSHIVFRPEVVDADGVARRINQAEAVRREILRGKETFEEAARLHSAAPSRQRGGDIGWIGREGPLVEAFSKPVFALAKGDISKPFVSPVGVHIAKVTDIQPGRLGGDAVRPKVEKILASQLIRDIVSKARAAAAIEYLPGAVHFDPATPADGSVPRRIIVAPGSAAAE